MLRAPLSIAIAGLVAACGQQSQTAKNASGPALDFIEATPIAEGALIEGPASPRPVVTPAVATPASATEKAADERKEPETAPPAKSTDRAGEAAVVVTEAPTARPAPAPRPSADEAISPASRVPPPAEPVKQAGDAAANPQPDRPN